MARWFTQIPLLLLLLLLLLLHLAEYLGVGEARTRCIQSDREALLHFKRSLRHDLENQNLLSSLGDGEAKAECCHWDGIRCSDTSGRVVMLDLSPWTSYDVIGSWSLRGNISSSLLGLRYLNYLDLSFMDLSEANDWIQLLYQLPYLKNLLLPDCNLPGFNSASLSVLDLSGNNLSSVSVYPWLFKYNHSLAYLNLSSNKLGVSTETLEDFGEMSALESLRLRNNRF
ncbi:LRR domain containing protein [Parasponia andersonii]|uniref:LRR domain containing protein n=1 Tax=Parasponia andersonii TaxID=3476 RepID=A0A2P5AZZ5_PARAD|nr:LRR domain containing protein [Parasponia andersonii]